MKRNMRFLLLFAILASSILAAYFISGCGDDSTIIESPTEENDTVVGTISGTVTDAVDGDLLVGCKVVWQHAGGADSAVTDGNGYFTTGPTLSAGNYTLTFFPASALHAAASYVATIHSVGWHQTTTPNAHGVITEEVSLNPALWPMTGTLSGYVYTALPTGAPAKDGEEPLALDGPNNISAAPNVPVTLDFGAFHVIGDTYETTTDANGFYSFTGVPACENYDDNPTSTAFDPDDMWIVLKTAQFTVNDILYGHTEYSGAGGDYPIEMGQQVPAIYAPLFGNPQRDLDPAPVVISYSWEDITPLVGDNLVMSFSHSMVPATVAVTGFTLPFVATWSNENKTLTLDPTSVMQTTHSYTVTVNGEATNGLTLIDNDGSTGFSRSFTTEVGIALLSTNLDDVAERVSEFVFTDFPTDGIIELTFNMVPNMTHTGTWVHLTETAHGYEVGKAMAVSGNKLTITPDVDLSDGVEYSLTFKIYSTIEQDYVQNASTYSVTTANDCVLGQPVIVDYDDEIDYNTTGIMLEWNVMPDADKFYIWAADDFNNPDRRIIDSVDAQQSGVTQTRTVTLPAGFDRYTDAGQTPFAAGTEVTFWVQGRCGSNLGAYSAPIAFSDNVGPADFIYLSNNFGTADNAGGATAAMPYIFLGHPAGHADSLIEYVANTAPVITFVEGGGDPAYKPTAYTWQGWNGTLRYSDTLFVTIPAGAVGAGDWMKVTISDNSGNTGTDSIRLAPYIQFVEPSSTSAELFTAPSFDCEWTTVEPQGGNVVDVLDLFISYDGGTTWDTLMDGNNLHSWASDADAGAKTLAWLVDTVRSADCKLALANHGGGFKFSSESFIYAGVKLNISAADSTDLVDGAATGREWWFDREHTDSTAIPFSISSVGFDEVAVVYSYDGWTHTGTDTFFVDIATPNAVTSTSVTNYYPYTRDADYNCNLGVVLPIGQPDYKKGWAFPVKNDRLAIQQPNASSSAPYRANFNITWFNITGGWDSLASNVNVYWADMKGDPDDTTWNLLGSAVPNKGYFIWEDVAPTLGTDSAIVRVASTDGSYAVVSALFDISGLTLDTPEGGEEWEVGSSHDIEWTNYGIMVNDSIRIERFIFDAVDEEWVLEDTLVKFVWPNDGDWTWTVPAPAYDSVQIRVREWSHKAKYDDSLVQEMSETFAITGFFMTAPEEAIYMGRIDTITWNTVGTFSNVTLGIGSAGHSYFDTVITPNSANTGTFVYTVPTWDADSTTTDAYVYVKTAGGGTAADTTAKTLLIINPDLVVSKPVADTVIYMSSTPTITWTTYGNRVGTVMLELSVDDGVSYEDTLIVHQTDDDADPTSYQWFVPVYPSITDSAFCKIRVTEEWTGQGLPLQGESETFILKPNPPTK
ncbi:MAG: hypothetical protein ABIE70_09250 [bacterium]